MNKAQILAYLYGNRVAIGSATALIVTAAIKTAPIPASTLGKWAYDFGHQVFNITNTRMTNTQVITPPEGPASPK